MLTPLISTPQLASIFGFKKRGGSYSHFCSRLQRHFARKDIKVQWFKTDRKKSSGGRPLRFAELTLEQIETWLAYVSPKYIDGFRQILLDFKGFTDLPERVERAFNEGIKARRVTDKEARNAKAIAAPPKPKPTTEPKTLPAQPPKPPVPPTKPSRIIPDPFAGQFESWVPYKCPAALHDPKATIADIEKYCVNAEEKMPNLNGKPITTDAELKEFQRVMRFESDFRKMDYLLGYCISDLTKQKEFAGNWKKGISRLGYNPFARFEERYTRQNILDSKEVRDYFFVLVFMALRLNRLDWRELNWDFACSLGLYDRLIEWEIEYGAKLL